MFRWGNMVRSFLALLVVLTLAWFTAMSCQVPSVNMSSKEHLLTSELKLQKIIITTEAPAEAVSTPPPCKAGGRAGNCTHSAHCSASHFCHPEEKRCQPFCRPQSDASERAMRNCSKCMEVCEGSSKCLGFIEERPAREALKGGCAKQLLLYQCPKCMESCRELPNDMPIRFPKDEPREGDFWITSYPKTGSTWVRHLITNLYSASEGNMNIADFKTVDEFIPFIEDGKGWTNMTMFRQRTGFRMWKSHQPFHCDTFPCKGGVVHRQGSSQCLCPNCAAKFKRVIYIYRNGYSTLASYFRFRLGLGQMGGRNFGSFINDRRMYPGVSWADHFRSWQHAATSKSLKIYWLRYEDLQASPESELKRVAAFLHLNVTEEHISFAINASSAKTMQEMEQREGGVNFFKIRYNKPKLKFVTGGSGELSTEKLWSQVSEESLAIWQLHNGPVMRCLGYPELPPQ